MAGCGGCGMGGYGCGGHPAFLQTTVIDKPIPAPFAGALQSAAIGGLLRRFSKTLV